VRRGTPQRSRRTLHQQHRSCRKSQNAPKYIARHAGFGIEAVISAVKGKNLEATIPKHIEYLYIPAIDHESFDLTPYFQDSNTFI
jgi:hypothetical protein